MTVLLWFGIFVLSLAVLVKASDWFVNGAEKIGLSLGIPSFIVGVTIVAVGTSLPELASSIASVFYGKSEIVAGNAIGSNITNILLVLGIVGVVGRDIHIKRNIIDVDIPMLIGSAFLLWFLIYDLTVSKLDAIILMLGLILFLVYTINSGQNESESEDKYTLNWRVYALVLASSVLIYFGADYTVLSISKLSELAGINTEVIALSLVSLGTSLPEVLVSISATRKGNPEIALGNIMGSNIFNTFAVMGIPSFIGVLTIPDSILVFSLPLMIAMTILFTLMCIGNKISRWEGYLLLLFYLMYFLELYKGVY